MNYLVIDEDGKVFMLHNLKPEQITKLVEAGFVTVQLDFEISNENQSQVVTLKLKLMDELAHGNEIESAQFHEEHLIVVVR